MLILPKNSAPSFSISEFEAGLHRSLTLISASGKSVFYVSENPELKVHPSGCLSRPLINNARKCDQDIGDVLERQGEYLSILENLPEDIFINSLDAFCAHETCIATDAAGALLYADGDHLSVEGSVFQYQTLIEPELKVKYRWHKKPETPINNTGHCA